MDSRLRRWARKISGSSVEHDREALQRNALASGSSRVAELVDRSSATCTGTITEVSAQQLGEDGWALLAAVDDGSGVLTLSWLGRRSIAGIEPGVMLTAHGRVSFKRSLPVMFNPRYEIIPCSDR
ncbi:ATP-dependent DNA helicase RecG [Yimella lutea]|uniref:ATP-dependent DNA helicase RecG n=1 Tax=Yimella lutea TaxID=587872 RepID=A0A542EGC3_9MICO|nr:OB-fold nucleic acid binding domain-containing protein [Yimella lutea]TQJ14296.1 ATP-dependent DNA helicase RecG [Yimella lutea]